ncbi:MAG TPA: hypothetical protein VFD39_08430 [Trueperaceae bacterium]|nr:hypothetical protein [Trueperaceae bacterium]
MTADPGFDVARAHEYFATECFNRCWQLIDKPERTSDEDEQMLLMSQASLWHWSQRDDYAPDKLAVGQWQLARVHALAGRPQEAVRHAQRSLEVARDFNAASATAIAADMPAVASDVVAAGVDPERAGEPGHGAELDDGPAYLLAYAHEAMARAMAVAGDAEASEFHRAEAMRLAREIDDAALRERLLADVDSL